MFRYKCFKTSCFLIVMLLISLPNLLYARRVKDSSLSLELNLSVQVIDQIIASDGKGLLVKSEEEKNGMAIIMLGYFKQRAEYLNLSLDGYVQNLENNREEIEHLLATFKSSSLCIITQSISTSLFRFRLGEVSDYLDNLIGQKVANDDLNITVKSVGSSCGLEALSAAMVVYDRLYNYAYTNISQDDVEIKNWVESWNINIDLYDIGSVILLKAINILSGDIQVPMEVSLWTKDSESNEVIEYRDYLLSRYLTRSNTEEVYADIVPELLRAIKFSFNYINLYDPDQVQRVVSTGYEIAFHANVTTVGDSPSNFPIEEVQRMLEDNFNPNYPGIGIWYKSRVNSYP